MFSRHLILMLSLRTRDFHNCCRAFSSGRFHSLFFATGIRIRDLREQLKNLKPKIIKKVKNKQKQKQKDRQSKQANKHTHQNKTSALSQLIHDHDLRK